jgi:hypothetical protein
LRCKDALDFGARLVSRNLGALEVENHGVDPSLPKRGRFVLAVNACPRRHLLLGELRNDILPDLSAGRANQDFAVFLCNVVLFFVVSPVL